MSHARRQHGFSLIELLIVVAIILVIAAIAIPNFLRSKMAANEASAVSSLKSITTAQVSYASTYPSLGFATDLTKLRMPPAGQPPTEDMAGYLDWVLACPSQPCPKSGFNFAIDNASGTTPVSDYRVTGVPINFNVTGTRGFCADQMGRITYDPTGGTDCSASMR